MENQVPFAAHTTPNVGVNIISTLIANQQPKYI